MSTGDYWKDLEEDEGEYWFKYKQTQRDKKKHYKENILENELDLLKSLPVHIKEIKDNNRYVLELHTDRGLRTIDYWPSSGTWKVRNGIGQGKGIQKFINYFKLTPKERE